jgi:hypothetical protein
MAAVAELDDASILQLSPGSLPNGQDEDDSTRYHIWRGEDESSAGRCGLSCDDS